MPARLPTLALAAAALLLAVPASGVITIHPGPYIDFSEGTPGYGISLGFAFVIDDDAITPAQKRDPAGRFVGIRSLRWDIHGNVTEYLSPYPNSQFTTSDDVRTVNNAGAAAGGSMQHGGLFSKQAVRWDASGLPTILDDLGAAADGSNYSLADGINSAGVAVGSAQKYGPQDVFLGSRAVRWDPGSTTAVELGHLGTDSSGYTYAQAKDINDAGVIIGIAAKFDRYDSDLLIGDRAVRWDPGSTTPVELALPPEGLFSVSTVQHLMINNAGMIAGMVGHHTSTSRYVMRALRWDPSGVVTELTLPANYVADSYGYMAGLNEPGVVIGNFTVRTPEGISLGQRALRWDPSTTIATVLPCLGLRADGYGSATPSAISNTGLIVGRSLDYSGSNPSAEFATLWTPANRVIDLNALIAPDSDWQLTHATAISDTGWITGYGYFDPDGPGGLPSFLKHFLLHVTYFDPGDFNLDGQVDAQDIDPFTTALADLTAYLTYLHDRMSTLAIDPGELDLILQFLDPNGDNLFNVQDINPFIATLSNAGVNAQSLALIPEPAAISLLLLAAPLLTRQR
ncbi:MAG: DUF3466 family protein [Phycisphaeraceae bacterium]|nr:DUF3466 family protein [Phycisphaeraceae bacterium]